MRRIILVFIIITFGAAVGAMQIKAWRNPVPQKPTPTALTASTSDTLTIGPPTPPTRPPYDPALTRKAIQFWAKEVRSDPAGAIALSTLAHWYLRSYRETGDMADVARAERAARRSLKINARNYSALIQLSRCLLTQHRFADALAIADKAAKISATDAQSRALRAEINIELGNYKAARNLLYKVPLALDDANGKALRARLCEIEGNSLLALSYLHQAQRIADRSPNMPRESVAWYHMRVGDCLASLGRWKSAQQAYHEALDLFPADYRTMAALARVAAGRGDWEGVIEWGRKSVEIAPSPETVALIGDAAAALGNQQEAKRQYQLVEAMGTLAKAQGVIYDRQRALFYADHNSRINEAIALARRELETRKDIYAYDTLAWVCYKNGRLAEANAAMRKALAFGTRDASLHYHAGMISHAMGNNRVAKAHLERALEINPYFHPFAPKQTRALLNRLG